MVPLNSDLMHKSTVLEGAERARVRIRGKWLRIYAPYLLNLCMSECRVCVCVAA